MAKTKQKILIDLAIGFLAVTLLILLKVYLVEGSFVGHWIDAKGYEILHKVIPPFSRTHEPSVVVLDISELKRESDGTTPIKSLQDIVEALIASKAKAIAIDVDFSPRIDLQGEPNVGPRSEDDEEFFKYLRAKKQDGVNIVVGVYNPGVESETWLTPKEYRDLAADMTIFDEDTTLIPRWMKCGNEEQLDSISTAMAKSSDENPAPSFPFRSLLEKSEMIKSFVLKDKTLRSVSCDRAFALINYAKLEFLQDMNLQAPDKESVFKAKTVEGKSKFENKLVIIGNTQRGMADCFVVPGQTSPVAGAYLHASAVYSLVDEPVFKFRPAVIILLDLFLGSIVVIGLFLVRWKHLNNDQFSFYLWEGRFILFAIVLTFVLGLVLVRAFNILWLDFFLVVIALLLHSQVQEGLKWIPKSLWRWKSPSKKNG